MKLCEFFKVSYVNAIDLVTIHTNKIGDYSEDVILEKNLIGHQIQEYSDYGWEITAIYMGDNGHLQVVCDRRRKSNEHENGVRPVRSC